MGNLVVKNRRGIRSVAVLDDESLSTKNDSKRSAVIRVLRCLFFLKDFHRNLHLKLIKQNYNIAPSVVFFTVKYAIGSARLLSSNLSFDDVIDDSVEEKNQGKYLIFLNPMQTQWL